MGTPTDKVMGYFILTLVVEIVLGAVVSLIVGVFLSRCFIPRSNSPALSGKSFAGWRLVFWAPDDQ
jgi:NhaP-type Na+/H+ or K+/H+ antiporter